MMETKNEREKGDALLFNRIAFQYARKDTVRSSSIPRKSLLLEAAGPIIEQRGTLGRVLDIGCGTGAPARYLKGFYREYTGVDQSENMIDTARLINRDIPDTRFLTGNIKTVHLSPHSFDFVLSVGALHHMTDLDTVMKAVCRLVKNDGYILVIEPQNGNPLIQMMRRIRMRLDSGYSRDQLFFSRRELLSVLENNGIDIVSCRYMGYFSTALAEVVLKPQFLFVPLSRFLTRLDSWLARRLPGWLRRMGFKLVVTGKRAPSPATLQ